MRKFMAVLVSALAVATGGSAAAASSSVGTGSAADSARWVSGPTCTATATTLTCTGRAAGIQPDQHYPIVPGSGPLKVGLFAAVKYLCLATGATVTSVPPFRSPVNAASYRNGELFTLAFSPSEVGPAVACPFPTGYLRLPGYFDVHVAIGWGYGSCCQLDALREDFGTVMPE